MQFLEYTVQLMASTFLSLNSAKMAKACSIKNHNIVSMYKVLALSCLILLIVQFVDFKEQFLSVEISWPDSIADSWIFQNSYLGSKYIEAIAGLNMTTLIIEDDIEEDILACYL